MLAPIPKTRALLISVSLVFLSYLITPAPPVTSAAFPRLIVFEVLTSMEGVRTLNVDSLPSVELLVGSKNYLVIVIEFAVVRAMDGDAA